MINAVPDAPAVHISGWFGVGPESVARGRTGGMIFNAITASATTVITTPANTGIGA